MQRTRIIGIDPGLVHTGVVEFLFLPGTKAVVVRPRVISGANGAIVAKFVKLCTDSFNTPTSIFIEGYRPRSHFDTDGRMVSLVKDLHHGIAGSKVVDNTGVKHVITRALLRALECWTFTTTTHHQDLRSAAYIGLYGMVKDPELNPVLADFVRDRVDGAPWKVGLA